MRPYKLATPSGVLLLIAFMLVSGCESTPGESLFDPDREAMPAPSIQTVAPAENWLAGIGEITITGSNFSPNPDENLVYFDAQQATVISASESELVVQTPAYIAENATLRVTTLGARDYSNTLTYRLDPAAAAQGGLAVSDQAVAMTYSDGTLYTSTTTGGLPSGVQTIDVAAGSAERYAAPRNWRYTDLVRNPETGDVFMARGTTPIIYRVPPGGGEDETWLLRQGLGAVATLTLDDAGYIWAAGNNPEIYRVDADQVVTPFPFAADVRAIVFAGGSLYAAATSDGVNGAWRIPLTSTSEAGEAELLLDIGAAVGGSALSIEAAADGTVFVGTDAEAGIVQIDPSGDWRPLHPGIIAPSIIGLSFGESSERYEGNILYALHDPATQGEPNQILRIESLKESR